MSLTKKVPKLSQEIEIAEIEAKFGLSISEKL